MTNPAYRVIVSDGQTNRVTLIFTSSTTWTVPDDWNSGRNWIEGIGGGGSGSFVGGCHGGGGGAYTLVGNVSLSPGGSIPIVIGAGGTLGSNGGNTTFNTSTLVAQGGYGGVSDAPGLGGQASLCIPSQTARSGGNGAPGSNTFGPTTYYNGSAGGGGGGAAGPNFQGQPGGLGNIYLGGGGGGGAGGSLSLGGFTGTLVSGSRFGGNGGAGPLAIGGGNGNIGAGQSGSVGGGGGGGGIANIAIVYSSGIGGVSGGSGGSTTVTTLGITTTAAGGSGRFGGSASATVSGSIRASTGGLGGPNTAQQSFSFSGGGGGIGSSAAPTGSGAQSIDFQSLRSVVENLGYSWTGPGAGGTVSPFTTGGNATGFGCGGGGGWRDYPGFGFTSRAGGGNGLWGGGGGGGALDQAGGSGGNGAVVVQTKTDVATSNIFLSGNGVYIPPVNALQIKIWAIGAGAGGPVSSGSNPGGGAGSIAYMEINGGYQGGAGGAGGNGTVTANGWSNNTLFIGPGGGGGGGMLSRAVTDSIGPAQGTAGRGGYYGGGAGGGGGDYADGGPGLLVITYEPAGQSVNSIDVDDLLVLKSAVIPGNLSSVGANNWGQLGYSAISTSTLQQVGTSPQWASLTAGYMNSGAITSSGNLFVWGNNGFGQLGLNLPPSTVNSSPLQVGTGAYKQIAWGGADTNTFLLALAANGNIWASGNNGDYRLGDGTNTNRSSLVQLAVNNNNWKSVVAGFWYSLALTNQGQLWGWGDRSIAWTSASLVASTPVQLGSTTWESISAGYTFAMALTPDGSLYGWGSNNFGQLGLGDTTNRSSPVRVGALGAWRAVACGRQHVIAIANNGSLWSWGNNSVGQLGIGVSAGSRSSPVQIGTLTTWQFVSAGNATSLALRADGTLWTWGTNTSGGLGLGDINPRSSPTQVGSNINWKTASMGEFHMLAAAYPYMSLPHS